MKRSAEHHYSGPMTVASWLVVVLICILFVSPAMAHSLLLRSEPENEAMLAEPPQQVIAWYSEELETGRSSIRVFNDQEGQVDNGDGSVDLNDPDHTSMIVTLPAGLVGGRYTVRWTAVSIDDGDATEGAFNFTVAGGDEAAASAPLVQPSSTSAGTGGWSPGWIVAGLVALVAILLGLMIYILSSRRS